MSGDGGLIVEEKNILVADDKASVMQVMSLKPEGYLLKTLPPREIIQAVDDFFEKHKGVQHA